MDKKLQELLEKARAIESTPEELENHRINIAAANGHLTDARITVESMKATRTIMLSNELAR